MTLHPLPVCSTHLGDVQQPVQYVPERSPHTGYHSGEVLNDTNQVRDQGTMLIREPGWQFGQDTGRSTSTITTSVMGCLVTTGGQDLSLTSHPKAVLFERTAVSIQRHWEYHIGQRDEHPQLALQRLKAVSQVKSCYSEAKTCYSEAKTCYSELIMHGHNLKSWPLVNNAWERDN